MNWSVVVMVVLALATALGLNVAFKNRVVIESGRFIREDEAPYLYRMARWRLILLLCVSVAGGLLLAEANSVIRLGFPQTRLLGLTFLLMSLFAGNIVIEGFRTGRIRNGRWSALRSEPDFWAVAGLLSLVGVLFGGLGLLGLLGILP